jgi:Flp pilus assembly protein TadB
LAGIGVLALALIIAPPKTSPAVALAELDAARGRAQRERLRVSLSAAQLSESARMHHLGDRLRVSLERVGVRFGGLRSDLSLLNRTVEYHLAVTVLAGLGGFIAPIVVQVVSMALGMAFPASITLLLGLVIAPIAAVMPTLTARSQAKDRRRDFRHVVGSFLDLVAMNLAGGRGVPEALESAAGVSDAWAMVRIRDTLLSARLHGVTPWAALGELGDEIRIDELRDLAAALALVAEDGAKVRDSLTARATSMRKRELAEAEGKAGEQSQSMLVAQLLLCVGFLIFLVYPAAAKMLGM